MMAVTACFFLLTGCGLDVYYVLEPPVSLHYPVESSTSSAYTEKYITFSPYEDVDDSAFSFEGTEVYYKIYSNLSTCQSEYSALNTLTNSESTKANSASTLLNSYKFQRLKLYNNDYSPLIPEGNSGKQVFIRLTTYLDSEKPDTTENPVKNVLTASVYIGSSYLGVPVRYYGNRGFDFVRGTDSVTGISNDTPGTSSYEDDVSTNTNQTEKNIWYVTLYAFGIGHDSTFATYYSPITHLGTLRIDSSSKLN